MLLAVISKKQRNVDFVKKHVFINKINRGNWD